MKFSPWTAARLGVVTMLGCGALLRAQQLPSEPAKQFGTSITASFEGWFDSQDGSHNFLMGYLNRNRKQEIDIPIGPNNHIDPGGPDMGQPTHFYPGRRLGLYVVNVPKAFTLQQRLTWTITINGITTAIPMRLHPDYAVAASTDASGNTPPIVRFEENGPSLQGPSLLMSKALTRTTSVANALPLTVWVQDDAKYTSGTNAPLLNPPPPAEVTWTIFRGNPAGVKFSKDVAEMETLAGGKPDQLFKGKATTSATFTQPGEYVLQMIATDYSGPGGHGEGCCWTHGFVKVTVTP